jgi:hypothetical protein
MTSNTSQFTLRHHEALRKVDRLNEMARAQDGNGGLSWCYVLKSHDADIMGTKLPYFTIARLKSTDGGVTATDTGLVAFEPWETGL